MLATPIRVPTVSNISTNRNENIITKNSNPNLNAPAKSNLKNVGATEGGSEISCKDGIRSNLPASGSTVYRPMS